MHIIIAALGAAAAAFFWFNRARDARDAADSVIDAAATARGRIRQAAFKRRTNVHPADAIDDPRDAASAFALSVALERETWSRELERRTVAAVARHLDCDAAEAAEVTALAHWVLQQKDGPDMRRRLSKRLLALAGPEALPDTLALLHAVSGEPSDDPADAVADAEAELRRRFHA